MAEVKSATRSAWRILLKGLAWIVGIALALVLVIVAINAFDEDLSPEAKQLLAVPPNSLKPEQNLYLVLLGFDAMPDESPIAASQRRVAHYDEAAEEFPKDPRGWVDRAADWKEPRLKFIGSLDFCEPRKNSCFAEVEKHKDEIDVIRRVNPVLYQRYLDLPRLSGYYETARPSILAWPAFVPGRVRSLFLLDVALRIKSARSTRQRAAALDDLYADVAVWRRMLVGQGPLTSKLIAVSNLQEDYALLGDLIADPTIDPEPIDHEIDAILDLLARDDWKLRGVFAYEFRVLKPFQDQTLQGDARPSPPQSESDAKPHPWWEPYAAKIEAHFMKAGSTVNLDARNMMQLQKVADSDAEDFLAARDAYRQWSKDTFGLGLKYAYNPIGRLMADFGGAYDDYPLRAYDVAAFVRMVRLGYLIRRQKLRAEDVAAFMKAHPQWSTHPVDGRPFAWDASKRDMAVQPLAPAPKDQRFSIPIWTVDGGR